MNNTMIREFSNHDLKPMHKLIVETIDACYSGIYPDEAIQFFKLFHSYEQILKDADEGYSLVLFEENALIGTGTFLAHDIRRVFIHPSYQGKGFGKLIMKSLELAALNNGATSLILHSSIPAKPFYDNLGYFTQKKDSIEVANNQVLQYYLMKKELR